MKPLILIGGGGHCKSVIDVAEDAGFKILGILDQKEKVNHSVLGYEVIGTDDDILRYVDKAEFLITVGQIKTSSIRRLLYEKIINNGGRLATLIAKDAYVSKYAQIGEGTVILHKAFVNAGAIVGRNCIINTLANIEHDAQIGNHSHISTGSMVNGECKVGQRCFIGSQSVLANCISIGDDIIVGAGSFVRKSIMERGIYSGNPAILIV